MTTRAHQPPEIFSLSLRGTSGERVGVRVVARASRPCESCNRHTGETPVPPPSENQTPGIHPRTAARHSIRRRGYLFTVIYTQTSERGVGVSLGAQSEVDRSDGVCGTSFGMSASPIGRKKIAHRFIGGYCCENRKSPVRDGRARLWRQHFLSPLRGSDLSPP